MRVARLLGLVGALAAGCLHPRNNDNGGPINLATADGLVFVARGTSGLDVVDGATGEVLFRVMPTGESDSFDDVSVADGILFALDADDGFVSTFLIGLDGGLEAAQRDVEVPVGAYSGISASQSIVAVSGGTTEISFFRFVADGTLSRLASLAGHRGHPDIALHPTLPAAFVSTHYSDGDHVDDQAFGIVSATLEPAAFVDELGIEGAGFTEGGGTPASFPLRVAFADDAIIAVHGGGLTVLEAGDDLSLGVLATLPLDIEAVDVVVDGSTAYAAGSYPTPQVVEIDLSDLENPVVAGSFPIGGEDAQPTAVVVVGPKVFVAAGKAGLVELAR